MLYLSILFWLIGGGNIKWKEVGKEKLSRNSVIGIYVLCWNCIKSLNGKILLWQIGNSLLSAC